MLDSVATQPTPALVDVFMPLAREWRDAQEVVAECRRKEEEIPKEEGRLLRESGASERVLPPILDELGNTKRLNWGLYDRHPLWILFASIRKYTGFDEKTLQKVAWRINSGWGLHAMERNRCAKSVWKK